MRPLPCLLLSAAAFLGLAGRAPAARHEPLRIVQTESIDYPLSPATINLPTGETRVVIAVDASGRLTDALVSSYSHREFADAALAALRTWRYEPAREDGAPVGVRREVVFRFEANKAVMNLVDRDLISNRFDRLFGTYLYQSVVPAAELDAPPRALHAPQPKNPAGHGRAVVDFFIDHEGRPRMPVVLESDTPDFASAALSALEQWKFAPPQARGDPVAVRVRQEFRF